MPIQVPLRTGNLCDFTENSLHRPAAEIIRKQDERLRRIFDDVPSVNTGEDNNPVVFETTDLYPVAETSAVSDSYLFPEFSVANIDEPKGKDASLVTFEDSFQKFSIASQDNVFQAAIPHLKEKGIDIQSFDEKIVPDNFSIDWETYPAGCSFGKHEKGFEINSPNGIFSFYGKKAFPFKTNSLSADMTVTNLSGNRKSHVKFGLTAMETTSASKHIYQSVDLEAGASMKFSFETNCFNELIDIIPNVSVQGNVVVENMHITGINQIDLTHKDGEIATVSGIHNQK